MKFKTAIAASLLAVSFTASGWGGEPGPGGNGGEPPGPNMTFNQGSQPQCFSPGDFWDEFLPALACGYVPVKPPIGWKPKPMPPIFVPTPPLTQQ